MQKIEVSSKAKEFRKNEHWCKKPIEANVQYFIFKHECLGDVLESSTLDCWDKNKRTIAEALVKDDIKGLCLEI